MPWMLLIFNIKIAHVVFLVVIYKCMDISIKHLRHIALIIILYF